MTNEIRICKFCGRQFTAKHARKVFCCSACGTKWHNDNNRIKKTPKKCIICGREFIPWNKTQVTCGSKECKYAHNLSQKKKKKGAYLYAKNSGLPQTQPQVNKKYKKWEECTPAERWERMTWLELSAELIRMHITYGQAQTLKEQGRLPDDFGLGLRQQQDI